MIIAETLVSSEYGDFCLIFHGVVKFRTLQVATMGDFKTTLAYQCFVILFGTLSRSRYPLHE